MHRLITKDERRRLLANGCSFADDAKLEITEPFQPDRIRDVHFAGAVRIGSLAGTVEKDGISLPCGIAGTILANTEIGDSCRIQFVPGGIINMRIGTLVVIENVDELVTETDADFAIGVRLNVLNEAGGRELPMFPGLSAQLAYLLVMYRHRQKLQERLVAMIDELAASWRGKPGFVGRNSILQHCGSLRNLYIGEHSNIIGAAELQNGAIASQPQAPVFIGRGVMARNFIIESDSHVDSGAMLDHVYVGQGCRLGKLFSAEHSCFFANCDGFHGEACSLFAGPYSVTHHKATLLIAAYVSFYNAGSGSNQSNHMYKLGPAHQGVLERGSKTGSDSYLLWPSHVGAFSTVIGRHSCHLDTATLPFSLLIGNEKSTMAVPAANLRGIGALRDAAKWPNRDRRHPEHRLDRIHFDRLNPFILTKILDGIQTLEHALQTHTDADELCVSGVVIKKHAAHKAVTTYRAAVKLYLSQAVQRRLEQTAPETLAEFIKAVQVESHYDCQSWFDWCGCLVPRAAAEDVLQKTESGQIGSLESVEKSINFLYKNYPAFEWAFVAGMLQNSGENLSVDYLIKIMESGLEAQQTLQAAVRLDAEKEFVPVRQIGYGLDGGKDSRQADFKAVRGSLDDSFLSTLENQWRQQDRRSRDWISSLQRIKNDN